MMERVACKVCRTLYKNVGECPRCFDQLFINLTPEHVRLQYGIYYSYIYKQYVRSAARLGKKDKIFDDNHYYQCKRNAIIEYNNLIIIFI